MPGKRFSEYDPFAWIYNRHWGDVFTPSALEAIDRLLLPKLPAGAQVLDLCCGTGQLAAALSDRGYVITGIDGSAKMLHWARANAPRASFHLADARSFSVVEKFEAVTCVFDSLNHIMSIDDLTSVFKSVRSALADGGLFLFDFTTEASFIAHADGVYGVVEDDHVFVHKAHYNPLTGVGDYEFTVFRLIRGEWRRSDFVLRQRSHHPDEVLAALERSGFEDAVEYAYDREHGLRRGREGARRVVVVCKASAARIGAPGEALGSRHKIGLP